MFLFYKLTSNSTKKGEICKLIDLYIFEKYTSIKFISSFWKNTQVKNHIARKGQNGTCELKLDFHPFIILDLIIYQIPMILHTK